MIEFKSILAEEMNSFLSLYEQEVGKESYYIATRHLIKFDEYLSGISCSDKNLTEQQIYDWLGTFDIKKSSVCKIVTVLRGFLRHLEGYGYRPFIPPYPKVRDDYVATSLRMKNLTGSLPLLITAPGLQKSIHTGM